MNFGTKIRTILVIATSLHTALLSTDLTGFSNPKLDTAYKVVSLCLNFIIVACAAYYNNDFTTTAAKYTGMMRLEKEQKKGIITGENFFDEAEEETEAEDLDEEDAEVGETE